LENVTFRGGNGSCGCMTLSPVPFPGLRQPLPGPWLPFDGDFGGQTTVPRDLDLQKKDIEISTMTAEKSQIAIIGSPHKYTVLSAQFSRFTHSSHLLSQESSRLSKYASLDTAGPQALFSLTTSLVLSTKEIPPICLASPPKRPCVGRPKRVSPSLSITAMKRPPQRGARAKLAMPTPDQSLKAKRVFGGRGISVDPSTNWPPCMSLQSCNRSLAQT
jgi:hypothetical protein